MASKLRPIAPRPAQRVRKPPKTAKTYRLDPARIAAARRILGAPTATATIEAALDLVVFRDEIMAGTRSLRGMQLGPFDTKSG